MTLPLRVRVALIELTTRKGILKRIVAALHSKQREFALNAAKRIAAHCGRRSGKSHGVIGRIFLTALQFPGELSAFIAISAARANELVELAIRSLGRKIGWIPVKRMDQGSIYWRFPNGHRLWVAGCANKADAEKFRGPRYASVSVDEADSIRGHLKYLVEECLEPALMDLDGWMALTGTPGTTLSGYFYDVTTGSNGARRWDSVYHWTCLDNPFLRDPAAWLRNRREQLGVDETSPSYRREYLGLWVKDSDSLVYAFSASINVANDNDRPTFTDDDWRFVIGIDLGVDDATAFVAIAYRLSLPVLWVMEAAAWTGMGPTRAYCELMLWRQRYPNARVVVDTGGLGKGYSTEWAQIHGLAVESARKVDKVGQIALVNGMLRSGNLRFLERDTRELIAELEQLPWDEKRKGPDPAYADHLSDALRYAALACSTHYKSEEEPPKPDSREWYEQEARKRKETAIAESMRRARRGRAA